MVFAGAGDPGSSGASLPASHQPAAKRYFGVYKGRRGGWRAQISFDGCTFSRSSGLDTAEKAAEANDNLVRKHHLVGKRPLNFPRPQEAAAQAAMVHDRALTSRYVGVSRARTHTHARWLCDLGVDSRKFQSTHATEEEAARAYDVLVRQHGLVGRRRLNFPRPEEAAAQAAAPPPPRHRGTSSSDPMPSEPGISSRAEPEPPAAAARQEASAATPSATRAADARPSTTPRGTHSRFIAVYHRADPSTGGRKWYARFSHRGILIGSRMLADEEEAALAYDALVRRHALVAERLLNFPRPDETAAQAAAALVARGGKAGGKRAREEAPTEETEDGRGQEEHAPLLAQLVEPASAPPPAAIAELAVEREAREQMRAELERTSSRLRLVEQAADPSRLRVLRLVMEVPPAAAARGGGTHWGITACASERRAALRYLSELEARARGCDSVAPTRCG